MAELETGLSENPILTRGFDTWVQNSLNYKQHVVANPNLATTYFSKTPFIRMCSNAVSYDTNMDGETRIINSTDIAKNESEYNSAVWQLITLIKSASSGRLAFQQTSDSYIPYFYILEQTSVDKKIFRANRLDTQDAIPTGYKPVQKHWSDIFVSGSYVTPENLAGQEQSPLSTDKLILEISLKDGFKFNVTEKNAGLMFDEFFDDPTFSPEDFFNILMLNNLSEEKNTTLYERTIGKTKYYIITISNISSGNLLSEYSALGNPSQVLVVASELSRLTLRYVPRNIIDDSNIKNVFNKIKLAHYIKNQAEGEAIIPNFLIDATLDSKKFSAPNDILAKNNILESITTVNVGADKYEVPGGVGAYIKDRSFGIESSGLGMRPRPGIVSFEVSSKGTLGVLRKAKVSIKAFTMQQLEDIQRLYMRPGIFVFLEWGWSVYPKLNPTEREVDFENVSLAQNYYRLDFFNSKTSSDIQKKTLEYKKNTFGHYDAMFAVTSNFNWVLTDSAEYDITVELTSHGNSLMGMKPSNSIQSILYGEYEPLGIFKEVNALISKKSELDFKGKKYLSLGTILNAINKDISGMDVYANETKFSGQSEDSIAKMLYKKDTAPSTHNGSQTPTTTTPPPSFDSLDKSKKDEYIQKAKDIILSIADLKRQAGLHPNVVMSGDRILVLDISDEANFLTSINPDKVIIINVKNMDKFKKSVPCFGKCEYNAETHLSNIDLRNVIFIEKDVVLKDIIQKQSQSLDALFINLFSVIKLASSEVLNLYYHVDSIKTTDINSRLYGAEVIRIMDINSQDYSELDKKTTSDSITSDLFQFSLLSTNSIVKNVALSTRLPSSFQRAAFVSSTNLGQANIAREDALTNLLDRFSDGYVNNATKFAYLSINDNSTLLGKLEYMKKKISFEAFYSKLMSPGKNTDAVYPEHNNEDFMNEFRYYYFKKLNKAYELKHRANRKSGVDIAYMTPPVGINLTLTIDGTSGIDWGSLITVDYLPLMLQSNTKNARCIFYVTEIVDVLNENGWETKLTVLLRAIGKRK